MNSYTHDITIRVYVQVGKGSDNGYMVFAWRSRRTIVIMGG
jgi:hypothetical protein